MNRLLLAVTLAALSGCATARVTAVVAPKVIEPYSSMSESVSSCGPDCQLRRRSELERLIHLGDTLEGQGAGDTL